MAVASAAVAAGCCCNGRRLTISMAYADVYVYVCVSLCVDLYHVDPLSILSACARVLAYVRACVGVGGSVDADASQRRCRYRRCGVTRVTHPEIVLTLLATEPSRSERARRSMCRERYNTCSRYNCRWWVAVALGGDRSHQSAPLNSQARITRDPAPARSCSIALIART